MRIEAIYSIEGNRQKLDGGAMFGNAPKALWSRWLAPDEDNRVTLACRALLLRLEDGRHILFETGVGAFFDPAMKDRYGVIEHTHELLNGLNRQGLTDKDIDIVILSHLHFDHAGGLLSEWKEGEDCKLLFPNAEYWVSKEQWQRANHPHMRDKASYIPKLNQLLRDSRRLQLIEDGHSHLLEPLVSFSFSNGHTPGLMLSHIQTDAGLLVFCSDLVPASQWVHLPISMGYDRYPELLCNEKKGLLEHLLYEGGFLFFTHDPSFSTGKVLRDHKGRFYVNEQSLQKLINVL